MKRYLVAGILLLLVLSAVAWWRQQKQAEANIATVIHGGRVQPPRKLGVPALWTHTGETLRLADFKGRWSLLYFGYTHCPDICPTTLQTLVMAAKQASEKPGGDATFPRVFFVSVDPERDTPQTLANYIRYFNSAFSHPVFIAVSGKPALLKAFALQFNAVFHIAPHAPGDDSYSVDHSAALYVIDPDGKLAAILTPPFSVERLLRDLARISSRQTGDAQSSQASSSSQPISFSPA